MNEQLGNPFTPDSQKPKRSLVEVFRRGKKEGGEDEIEKALKSAQATAKEATLDRERSSEERHGLEELFESELTDQAFICIQSLVTLGYSDENLLKSVKVEDGEIISLYLKGLTSAEHLTLPDSIGGDLGLSGLTSAEHLTLPDSIGGDLYLSGLTSAEHLTLPDSIGGYLDLRGLTSAEHLTLPDSIGGYLDLRGLTSAEHLTLPESIGGGLDLEGLTSAEHLTLPDSIGGGLYLNSMPDDEKEKLRERYPKHADKIQ